MATSHFSLRSARSGAPTGTPFRGRRAVRVAWWRWLAAGIALWWLAAAVSDALLEQWWLQDAQGAAGGVDFWNAHLEIALFRWGGGLLGALLCGGWVWWQARVAIASARQSEASLGALGTAETRTESVAGGEQVLATLEAHETGRWIPLEDKLALDRFRPLALRVCVAAAAAAGAFLGARAWPLWLGFAHARPIGAREPWLGMDAAFYLFRLPALDFAWRVLLIAQGLALGLAITIYIYEDALQVGRRLWASKRALRHLAALSALLLLWKAVGAVLYPFELLIHREPGWAGPHALDWYGRVPLAALCALATVACAALCLRQAHADRAPRVLAAALAPLIFSWPLVHGMPALYALFRPQQQRAADAPFERAQVEWTRRALGVAANATPTLDLVSALGTREIVARIDDDAAAFPKPSGVREQAGPEASAAFSQPEASAAFSQEDSRGAVSIERAVSVRPEARTWEEAHVDAAPLVKWRRLSATASRRPDRTIEFLVGAQDSSSISDVAFSRFVLSRARAEQLARNQENSRPAEPNSFFSTSFERAASREWGRTSTPAPAFRVLQTSAAHGAGEGRAAVGVALDAAWKKWLAAWRLGSLGLALSPRVSSASRLAWRLDAGERCRAIAPFLRWPSAARPLVDARGQLFWLLDGHTFSAAFPLSRPLHVARTLAPNGAFHSARAARTPNTWLDSEARETLRQLSHAFDGLNFARASVAALVDARTGRVQMFPLDDGDPILSLYRRALPGLWSRPRDLPAFARAALRPPPALAALQAAVVAGVSQNTRGEARASTWSARDWALVPTPRGLRTAVLLSPGAAGARASSAASTSSVAAVVGAASTWSAAPPGSLLALAPVAVGDNQPSLPWQVVRLSTNSKAGAAKPLSPSTRPRKPVPVTARPKPGKADWKQARALWRQAQRARRGGDWERFENLSRRLEQLLEQNAR
jgi:hypothetical protein